MGWGTGAQSPEALPTRVTVRFGMDARHDSLPAINEQKSLSVSQTRRVPPPHRDGGGYAARAASTFVAGDALSSRGFRDTEFLRIGPWDLIFESLNDPICVRGFKHVLRTAPFTSPARDFPLQACLLLSP